MMLSAHVIVPTWTPPTKLFGALDLDTHHDSQSLKVLEEAIT
jgi:hypothetical protein